MHSFMVIFSGKFIRILLLASLYPFSNMYANFNIYFMDFAKLVDNDIPYL